MRPRANDGIKTLPFRLKVSSIATISFSVSLPREKFSGVLRFPLVVSIIITSACISLKLAAKTIDFLTESGFDPVYGARPLKRAIQKELETALARAVLSGEIKDGQHITANLVDEKIVFDLKNPPSSAD